MTDVKLVWMAVLLQTLAIGPVVADEEAAAPTEAASEVAVETAPADAPVGDATADEASEKTTEAATEATPPLTLDEIAAEGARQYADDVEVAQTAFDEATQRAKQAYRDRLLAAGEEAIARLTAEGEAALREFDEGVAKLDKQDDAAKAFDAARRMLVLQSERKVAAARLRLDELLALDPATFAASSPVVEVAAAPTPVESVSTPRPIVLQRITQPTPVVLAVRDDDVASPTRLWINGRDASQYNVKTDNMSGFLTCYRFTLNRDDTLVVSGRDAKTGAFGFWMADTRGQLIAYSHPGLPVVPAQVTTDQEYAALPPIKSWQPARVIPDSWSSALKQLLNVADAPKSMPDDWSGIWLQSAQGGGCSVLVYPVKAD